MFGEPVLQFEIHVGMPQKSLIFKVILPPAVGRPRLRRLLELRLVEDRGIPPLRQKEVARMGHGGFVRQPTQSNADAVRWRVDCLDISGWVSGELNAKSRP
jgi:hypothetical protein